MRDSIDIRGGQNVEIFKEPFMVDSDFNFARREEILHDVELFCVIGGMGALLMCWLTYEEDQVLMEVVEHAVFVMENIFNHI